MAKIKTMKKIILTSSLIFLLSCDKEDVKTELSYPEEFEQFIDNELWQVKHVSFHNSTLTNSSTKIKDIESCEYNSKIIYGSDGINTNEVYAQIENECVLDVSEIAKKSNWYIEENKIYNIYEYESQKTERTTDFVIKSDTLITKVFEITESNGVFEENYYYIVK